MTNRIQKVVRLSVVGESISDYIKDGWRVVIATPIIEYSYSPSWREYTTETRYIEYIIEREVNDK